MPSMTRRRSRALLGTASAVALAAGLGLATPKAQAQVQSIVADVTWFRVSVEGAGSTGFDILNDATVSNGGNFEAFLVDAPVTDGIAVTFGAIDGDAVDTDVVGLNVQEDVEGGIANGDEISATALTETNDTDVDATAILIAAGTEVEGGIGNDADGTITAYAGQGTDQSEADWTAHGIAILEGSEVEDGIVNGGLIAATAGEIATLDGSDTGSVVARELQAFAYGVRVAEDSEVEGDVINTGTIAASATAFGEVSEAVTDSPGTFALAVQNVAEAYGISIEGSGGLDGEFANHGTITASALAGGEQWVEVVDDGGATSVSDVAGDARALAYGAVVEHDGDGLDLGGFLNSGWIEADAEARLGKTAIAVGGGEFATAVAGASGEVTAEAVGVEIDIGENLLLGSVINELGATIRATATAAQTADATATTDGGDSEASSFLAFFADSEATGADVRLDSLLGDVTNDGSIVGVANASLAATASATGSNSLAETGRGTADAEARGGILIADLIIGDVTAGEHAEFVAIADASNTATATSVGASVGESEPAAAALAYAGEANADSIGYYVNVELLGGDFVNHGTILGEATATSQATATATGPGEGVANAQANGGDAFADANGAVLIVDALTGGIEHTSLESIAAVAIAQSLASASVGEADGGEPIAESQVAFSAATGLLTSMTLLGEGFDNAGSITGYARSLAAAEAIGDVNESGDAVALSGTANGEARGVVLDVDVIALPLDEGGVSNSGLVGAIAHAASEATAAQTSGGIGFAATETDGADAFATGFTVDGDALVGHVTNGGTITALGEALSSASATVNAGGLGIVDAEANQANAFAEGLAIYSENVIGSVSNGESGLILAEANARVSASAIAATGEAGIAEAGGGDGITDARAAGLKIHGDGIFKEENDGVLAGHVDNAGTIGAVASAVNTAWAQLTVVGDGDASSGTADNEADADGVEIESALVLGEIANSGTIFGDALAANNSTASILATGEGLSVADANGADSDAYADGYDIDVGNFSGSFFNSGTVAGYATASNESVASVTTGALGRASVFSDGAYSEGQGLDLYGEDGFVGQVTNAEGGLVLGQAHSSETVTASVLGGEGGPALAAEADSFANRVEAFADGMWLQIDNGIMAALVQNHGTVVGEAVGSIDVGTTVVSRLGEGEALAFSFAEGFDVEADGIDIETDEGFLGEILNRGSIIANSHVDAEVTAHSTGEVAHAEAGLGESYADAAGIEISGNLFTGTVSTGSTIEALTAARTHIAATATGRTNAEGVARQEDIIDLRAWGIVFEREDDNEFFTGEISNAADGLIQAQASHVGETLADATGGNAALALAGADEAGVDIFAAGIEHDVGFDGGEPGEVAIGDIVNHGTLYAGALGEQTVIATAVQTGETAAGGGAVASGEMVFYRADAEGFNFRLEDILADFTNDGTMMAIADVALHHSATATAEGVGGLAVGEFYTDFVGSDVEGMDLNAGENFVGNIANGESALLYAAARTEIWQMAQATSQFNEAEAFSAVGGLSSTTDGMDIDGQIFDGEILNRGTIDASAMVAATVGAVSVGELSGEAIAELSFVDADADGVDIDDSGAIHGDVLNHGTVLSDVGVNVAVTASATTEPGGYAFAQATDDYTDAEASGLEIGAESFIGDIANSGSVLDVVSVGERLISAEASGGNNGIAIASTSPFQSFFVGARGLDLDQTGDGFQLLNGDMRNGPDGEILVTAIADTTISAVAAGAALADAEADGGESSALAMGFEIELVEMVGDAVNDGVVTAFASNSVETVATATGNDFASASADNVAVLTEAYGIGFYGQNGEPGEAILVGDIINNGTIAASANGPHSAMATASSLAGPTAAADSYGLSSAWGMFLDTQSILGDFLNTNSITALSNEVGTIIATGEAENEGGAVARGGSDATAHGMQAITPEVIGDIGSGEAAEIVALANASVDVLADLNGFSIFNTALGEARALGAGIDLHPNSPEFGVPLAALSWYSGTDQDGRLYNHGSIMAMGDADATVEVGENGFADAAAQSVSQGMGAIVEAITDGVENSGTVMSSANATIDVAVGETSSGGGSSTALSYGILLLGELGIDIEVPNPQLQDPQFVLLEEPVPQSPLGEIGDLGDRGIAIRNSGAVYAYASAFGEAAGDAFAGATSYAAGLQVGRGGDAELLGGYLPDNDDFVSQGLLVDGDILNTGTLSAMAEAEGQEPFVIFAVAPDQPDATAIGLGLYDSIVDGNVDNTGGTILAQVIGESGNQRAFGIHIAGSVVGEAVNNTGLVMATIEGEVGQADALNSEWASGETTWNLLDGNAPNGQVSDTSVDPTFDGDNPLGVVGDIRLARYFADTINWSGGDIQGDIYGYNDGFADGLVYDDVLNVFAGVSAVFDYDGDITGLEAINVNTPDTALPVELTMRGLTSDTHTLNVNDHGTLVLGAAHPELVGHGEIWVGTYNHADEGTVLFELTPDPDDVGFIVTEDRRTLNIEGGTIGIRPMFYDYLYADETIYEVIYAGERVGQFDDTFSPTPLLDVEVEYGDYDGEAGDGGSGPGDVNDVPDYDDSDSDVRLRVSRVAFDLVDGLTPNQKAVAGGIETVYGPDIEGTPFGNAIALLFLLDEEEYPAALSTLHGAEHAQVSSLTDHLVGLWHDWLGNRTSASQQGGQGAGSGLVSWVYDPLAGQLAGVEGTERALAGPQVAQANQLAQVNQVDRAPGSFSVWTTGGGLWGSGDGDPGNDVVGFEQTTWGVMIGADYQVDENWLVGLAGNYQDTDADFDDGDTAEVDGFQVGAFASYTHESGFYGDTAFSVGWYDYDTSRAVYVGPTYFGDAEGETDAFVVTAELEVGYLFDLDGFLLQPLVGLEYTHASIDGFTESGATPFNLVVEDRDADSLESRLGFAASTELPLGGEMLLIPEVRAEWRHEFLETQDDVTSAFVGQPGSSFTAVGNDYGSDAAVVGAGLTLQIDRQFEVYVDYDGRFQGGYDAHAVSGGLKMNW